MEDAMPRSYEDKIKEQAQAYLDAEEHVIAAFIAQPRGATTANVGGLGPASIGRRKISQQKRAAEQAGLQMANPMALALTETRLLVLSVSKPIALGKGGDVNGLVSAVPLSDVDSIEIKRLLAGKIVIVTVRGAAIKLEAGSGANARGLADEFARARTTA
jgi:hypothetical protein